MTLNLLPYKKSMINRAASLISITGLTQDALYNKISSDIAKTFLSQSIIRTDNAHCFYLDTTDITSLDKTIRSYISSWYPSPDDIVEHEKEHGFSEKGWDYELRRS